MGWCRAIAVREAPAIFVFQPSQSCGILAVGLHLPCERRAFALMVITLIAAANIPSQRRNHNHQSIAFDSKRFRLLFVDSSRGTESSQGTQFAERQQKRKEVYPGSKQLFLTMSFDNKNSSINSSQSIPDISPSNPFSYDDMVSSEEVMSAMEGYWGEETNHQANYSSPLANRVNSHDVGELSVESTTSRSKNVYAKYVYPLESRYLKNDEDPINPSGPRSLAPGGGTTTPVPTNKPTPLQSTLSMREKLAGTCTPKKMFKMNNSYLVFQGHLA